MADENAAQGGSTGTGSGAASGAGASGAANGAGSGASTGTGTTAAGGTGATGAGTSAQPGAAAAQTGFTYTEDRSKWIPPHRLNEVTTRATRAEQELENSRRQVQALAGVQPNDPNAAKTQQVKDAFFEMFPAFRHLDKLTDEQMQQILTTPSRVADVSNAESREWARHGKTQMTSLFAEVAAEIGAEELSADQKADLKDGFSTWFRNKCQAELHASDGAESATLQRYEDGDPNLLREYVKRHSSNWVEPARRKVTAQTLTRTRPVPNSAGRAQVTSLQRPEKFANMDERLDYAAKLAKERGVVFGSG